MNTTTRQLTITAAALASQDAEGRVWLVGEGVWPKMCPHADPEGCNGEHCDCPLSPPAEFVQASAPCESCEDSRCNLDMCHDCGNEYEEPCARHRDHGSAICDGGCCTDCRIELVGPCLLCGGSGRTLGGPLGEDVGDCRCAMTEGLIVFGHAYAVGSPLPIYDPDDNRGLDAPCLMASTQGVVVFAATSTLVGTIITDRLAHAGPPEWLVGKWAMCIEVGEVGS